MNNNARIKSTSHTHNCKCTFASPLLYCYKFQRERYTFNHTVSILIKNKAIELMLSVFITRRKRGQETFRGEKTLRLNLPFKIIANCFYFPSFKMLA